MKGQKIDEAQYQEILQLYIIHGKISTVSKISKLHYNTIRKYKVRDNWDRLRDRERDKVVIAVGDKIRDSLKENLVILGELKDYGLKIIRDLHVKNDLKMGLMTFLKIIELESELAGLRPPDGDKDLNIVIQQYNQIFEKEGTDGIARVIEQKHDELQELAREITAARLGDQSGKDIPCEE